MKKLLFKIIIIIIAIIALWAGFNLLTDISEPEFRAGKEYNTSNPLKFIGELFPPVPVTRENGYYKLWTLTEPPEVDPNSDAVFENQKRLNDPETATIAMVKDWIDSNDNKRKKQYYEDLKKKRMDIIKKGNKWDNFPMYANRDWGRTILEAKEDVLKVQAILQPLMDRYQKIIDTEYFEDYTLVVIEKDKFNFSAPIPNLLAWLHVAKQYTIMNIMDALEGNWEKGTSDIIDHLDFAKRATKGSRTLIANLIGKAVLKISLFGIASVINQPDCPDTVYEMILNRLDDLEFDEYGSRKPLLAEGFSISQVKSAIPFFQVNRTKKYYYDHLSTVVEYEAIPPYKWERNPQDRVDVKKNFFWWIQNPLGKLNFEDNLLGNFATVTLKSIHSKTLYDMTRISAELHLKYDPEKSVQDNLNGLDLYKTLLDPCSGNPYIWHAKKQMLYSFGADRDDDGGKDGPLKSWDADFFLPVHLYIK